MSSYSRNLGGFGSPNNNDQNRPFTNNRKHIMCRLCNRVLYSTSALITHIESHIVEGDIASLDPNNHNQPLMQTNTPRLIPNPNPGLRLTPQLPPISQIYPSREPEAPRPIPTREPLLSLTLGRESFGGSQSFNVNLSRPPVVPMQRISPNDPRASSSGSKWPEKKPIWMVEDVVSPIDGTRPFINQLDRPIPNAVELEIVYDHGLDLTLKL